MIRSDVVDQLVQAKAQAPGDATIALAAVLLAHSPTEEEQSWADQRFRGMSPEERDAARMAYRAPTKASGGADNA